MVVNNNPSAAFISGNDPLGSTAEDDPDVEELRMLVDDRPTRWWRVDRTDGGVEMVEIWEGKGKLAGEVVEKRDFDPDRDLDCEYLTTRGAQR